MSAAAPLAPSAPKQRESFMAMHANIPAPNPCPHHVLPCMRLIQMWDMSLVLKSEEYTYLMQIRYVARLHTPLKSPFSNRATSIFNQ